MMKRNLPLTVERTRSCRAVCALQSKSAGPLYLAVLMTVWAATSVPAQAVGTPLTLWYGRPATEWIEALPVGNGCLGAMVFGGTANERIQFNEATLWNGGPHDYSHPGARKVLP